MGKVGLFILMDDKLKVFGKKVPYLKRSLKIQNNISKIAFLKNQKILKSNEIFEDCIFRLIMIYKLFFFFFISLKIEIK